MKTSIVNNWTIGETVLVETYIYGNSSYARHTIAKIMTSGIVVLDDKRRFRADGDEVGPAERYRTKPRIIKFDQAIYDAQQRKRRVDWVRAEGIKFLTDDECAELYAKLAARKTQQPTK